MNWAIFLNKISHSYILLTHISVILCYYTLFNLHMVGFTLNWKLIFTNQKLWSMTIIRTQFTKLTCWLGIIQWPFKRMVVSWMDWWVQLSLVLKGTQTMVVLLASNETRRFINLKLLVKVFIVYLYKFMTSSISVKPSIDIKIT